MILPVIIYHTQFTLAFFEIHKQDYLSPMKIASTLRHLRVSGWCAIQEGTVCVLGDSNAQASH